MGRDSRKLAKVLTETHATRVIVTMASILLAWRGLDVALQFIADTKEIKGGTDIPLNPIPCLEDATSTAMKETNGDII